MTRIAIILAMCALMVADLRAEATLEDRQRTAWPEAEERSSTPLSQWLPSVLPFRSEENEQASSSDPDPVSEPAPAPRRQQRSRTASQPKPAPEPEPQLTPEEQEAEAQWWREAGDPAVSTFSRCLAHHAAEEARRGSQSSYPEFVTEAMKDSCSREFGIMAQLILDRHGEDKFAKIARELITTKFVPAVRQAVEEGLPEEVIEPADAPANAPADAPAGLEAEMRQSKEVMFGCFVTEADRLAASSTAAAERVADLVIASCKPTAEQYFGKVEQLYPGTTGGMANEKSATILDASYRPAIVQRIDAIRADSSVRSTTRRDQP